VWKTGYPKDESGSLGPESSELPNTDFLIAHASGHFNLGFWSKVVNRKCLEIVSYSTVSLEEWHTYLKLVEHGDNGGKKRR
jgi:hypothetical protein